MKTIIIGSVIVFILVIISWLYFNYTSFEKDVAGIKTSSENINTEIKITGLILPHHGLARELIYQSLERIKTKHDFSYIVILGPNHFHPESLSLASSKKIDDYPIASDLIDKLKQQFPSVTLNQDLLEEEHSVTLLIPYLHQYFPQAQFVPLIFSPTYDPQTIEDLAAFLTQNLPGDTLYVLSLDFSHNAMALQALEKNEETIYVLKNFDYQTLYRYKDDHLDSPVATAYFLKLMEKLKAFNWETWYNTHTAFLKDDPTLQGTSYIIGVFYTK